MLLLGDHVINEQAIAWANLSYTWQQEHRLYDRSGTFAKLESVSRETMRGILLRFVDGSHLVFPDGLEATDRLRYFLTGRHAETPLELELIAGLPAELQAFVKEG